MLIEILLKLVFAFLNFIINLLPTFPEYNSSFFQNGLINNLKLLFASSYGFLTIFIRPITLNFAILVVIFLFNLELVYKFILWILRKIPFLNIK